MQMNSNELMFRPSVYGIIIENHQILLSKQWGKYDLPGGGIELGEKIDDALTRECKEETGLDIVIERLLAVRDSFFQLPDTKKNVHSILLYYVCQKVGGEISTVFFPESEAPSMEKAEWVPISMLSAISFSSSVNLKDIVDSAL